MLQNIVLLQRGQRTCGNYNGNYKITGQDYNARLMRTHVCKRLRNRRCAL